MNADRLVTSAAARARSGIPGQSGAVIVALQVSLSTEIQFLTAQVLTIQYSFFSGSARSSTKSRRCEFSRPLTR